MLMPFTPETLEVERHEDEDQFGSGFNDDQGISSQTTPAPNVPKKKGNWIRDRAFDRYRKLIDITYVLAKYGAFNKDYQIKLRKGGHLVGSDGVALLMHALSPGKHMVGIQEFVELLADAGVTPDMVINENVKAMLQKLRAVAGTSEQGTSYEEQTMPTTVSKPAQAVSTQTRKSVKRNLPPVVIDETEVDSGEPSSKRIRFAGGNDDGPPILKPQKSILRPAGLQPPSSMPTLVKNGSEPNWSIHDPDSESEAE